MKPSYVITPFGERVSRVNIVGTVVDKFVSEDGNYSSVTIDDGTEAVRVKSFEGLPFEKFNLGDFVRVIGKLKEYNGELYVSYEIMEKMKDANFEILSSMEILSNLVRQKKIVDDIKSLSNQIDETELKSYAKDTYSIDDETLSVIIENKKKEIDYKPTVLEVIKKMDDGNGIEIRKLFEVLSLPENVVERTLDELINSGSVYEPVAGRLRTV